MVGMHVAAYRRQWQGSNFARWLVPYQKRTGESDRQQSCGTELQDIHHFILLAGVSTGRSLTTEIFDLIEIKDAAEMNV
jgi:hypothetical protein